MSVEDLKPKKRGRREEIEPKELFSRYVAHKQFFESEWGRIGLALSKVRGPEGIRRVLMRVPNIQWCPPFRDYRASCLIEETRVRVNLTDLRETRRRLKQVENNERDLWLELQIAHEEASKPTEALSAFIDSHRGLIMLSPFFELTFALANQLRVRGLTEKYAQAKESFLAAQRRKAQLKDLLTRQEAWFARLELFKFAKNKREEKSALNYARATAGLPEYSWLHSFRKCRALHNESLNAKHPTYQLFEILKRIVQGTRSVDIRKTQLRFKRELLKADPTVQRFVSPKWAYMQQAFAQCLGKGFKRAELPYKIMEKYIDNVERLKTPAEMQLADRNQLLSN